MWWERERCKRCMQMSSLVKLSKQNIQFFMQFTRCTWLSLTFSVFFFIPSRIITCLTKGSEVKDGCLNASFGSVPSLLGPSCWNRDQSRSTSVTGTVKVMTKLLNFIFNLITWSLQRDIQTFSKPSYTGWSLSQGVSEYFFKADKILDPL